MKKIQLATYVFIISILQTTHARGVGWESIGLKDSMHIGAIGSYGQSTILAGDSKNGRMFVSENNGESWDTLYKDTYPGTNFSVLKMIDGVLFAGYSNRPISNLITSKDTGKTWQQDVNISSGKIYSIEKLMGSYFVGQNHLFMSTNGYTNWQQVPGPEYGSCMMAMVSFGSSLYLCSYNGFYASTDTSKTWNQISIFGYTNSVCLIDSSVIFTDENGAYRSDDSFNQHFKTIFTGGSKCFSINDSILMRSNGLFSGPELFYSLDKGDTWKDISLDYEGADSRHVQNVISSDKYVFALTDSGVARLSFDNFLSGVGNKSQKMTKVNIEIKGNSFTINSNYVNNISIKIYSISGRLIAAEKSTSLKAGSYQIKSLLSKYFKNCNLPTTFIINIQADYMNFNKMIINK